MVELNPTELVRLILDQMKDMDQAQRDLVAALHAEAEAEHDYRVRRAVAWSEAEGRSVDERSAQVDSATAAERRDRDLATGNAKASMELVRNKRQELSALQSLANALKAEAELAKVGPDTPDF